MQFRLCSSNRLEMASKRVKIVILSKKQIVISKVIKAKRLKFAQEHLNWIVANWKWISFPVPIAKQKKNPKSTAKLASTDSDEHEENLERIGVHDGMGDRSPNQLLAKLTTH